MIARTLLVLLPMASITAGCATPAPVRNLASQGATTVALAEISLRDYLAMTNAQLAARMDLLRQDTEYLANDRSRQAMDRMLDASAGLPEDDATSKMILALGNERRQLREKAAEELEKIAQDTAFDEGALPKVPREKLAAAKKGFAVLSDELSAQEWLSLAMGYAAEISKGVDSLRKAGDSQAGT